jgi:hypothetical protein
MIGEFRAVIRGNGMRLYNGLKNLDRKYGGFVSQ